MSQPIGLDCPSLAKPADLLRNYARLLGSYQDSERRYANAWAALSPSERDRPSRKDTVRLSLLEGQFERSLVLKRDAEILAVEALQSLGVEAGRGGVRIDTLLFAVHLNDDREDARPTVIVIDLAEVRDLRN